MRLGVRHFLHGHWLTLRHNGLLLVDRATAANTRHTTGSDAATDLEQLSELGFCVRVLLVHAALSSNDSPTTLTGGWSSEEKLPEILTHNSRNSLSRGAPTPRSARPLLTLLLGGGG